MKTLQLMLLLLIQVLVFTCDHEHLSHQLEVVNGQGTGAYRLGDRVNVVADPAPAEQGFFEWVGDIQYINQVKAPTATIIMPLQDIRVQATYKDLPKYRLAVVNGTGTGDYLAGTTVPVTAVPPGDDYQFISWIGDTNYVEQVGQSETIVNMPEMPISIEATFEELVYVVSFKNDILPMFQKHCSTPGCHDAAFTTPLTNYQEIWEARISSRNQIVSRIMPSSGPPLTQEQIDLYVAWVNQGAKNN